jgi:hypothetical protein
MDLTSIYAFGLLSLGAGTIATAVFSRLFPLWFLEVGQDHGRYAGLGSRAESSRPGTRGGVQSPVLGAQGQTAAG